MVAVGSTPAAKEKHMTDDTMTSPYQVTDSKTYTQIRYRVRIPGGPVLKGVPELEVMDFVTGYGHVVPGLERRLIGHSVGERLSFTVPPEEAFGPRHEELVFRKSREDFHFPKGMEPYVGMELPLVSSQLEAPETVVIREVNADTIVIDANHPLSGKALEYDLEIIEARPARSTDVCSEWDEKPVGDTCCSAVHTVTLGEGPSRDN
jgi:FKBP-type peptidyl-prolyl cis-trans isomerase 2